MDNWLGRELVPSKHLTGPFKRWNSTCVTVALLLACGASLVSSLQLLGSVSPDDGSGGLAMRHLGRVIAPLVAAASGLIAEYLHLHGRKAYLDLVNRKATMNVDRIIYWAIATTPQLFGLILPASILARWFLNAGYDAVVFSSSETLVLALIEISSVRPLLTNSADR